MYSTKNALWFSPLSNKHEPHQLHSPSQNKILKKRQGQVVQYENATQIVLETWMENEFKLSKRAGKTEIRQIWNASALLE